MPFSNTEAFQDACRNNGGRVQAAIEANADQKAIDAIEGALGFADERARKLQRVQEDLVYLGELDMAATLATKEMSGVRASEPVEK